MKKKKNQQPPLMNYPPYPSPPKRNKQTKPINKINKADKNFKLNRIFA